MKVLQHIPQKEYLSHSTQFFINKVNTHRLSFLTYVVQVAFASLALQVSSLETGTCEATVTRTGLFGDIRVQWEAGYPSGEALPGFRTGPITPSSGNTVREGLIPLNLEAVYTPT